MMNEVTWHEHCSNLKVKEGGGLVCPVCRIVIDVRGVFSTLAKWGGYKASGGETAEEYFSKHGSIIAKSNCEHLRYLGFLDASSFIDKNDLGKKFAEDPKFEEERIKEMQQGTDYSVFREWLLENEGGIMVDLSTYWEEFWGTDTKGTYHDIKNAGLVVIFQDVSVLG